MRIFAKEPRASMIRASRFRGWSVVWVAFTVAAFGFGIGFYDGNHSALPRGCGDRDFSAGSTPCDWHF
jgi:hypothetical protein